MSDIISSHDTLLGGVYESIKTAIYQALGNNAHGENAEAAAELTEQYRIYNELLDEPAPAALAATGPGKLQTLLAQSFNQAVKNEGGKTNGVGLARMANQIAELEIDIRNRNKPKADPYEF